MIFRYFFPHVIYSLCKSESPFVGVILMHLVFGSTENPCTDAEAVFEVFAQRKCVV